MPSKLDSILTDTKKKLGIDELDNSFDIDIIDGINSAVFKLRQLGIGKAGFSVKGPDEAYSDFLAEDTEELQGSVSTFIYQSTKLGFDPPTASLLSSMERNLDELGWRLNVYAETKGVKL